MFSFSQIDEQSDTTPNDIQPTSRVGDIDLSVKPGEFRNSGDTIQNPLNGTAPGWRRYGRGIDSPARGSASWDHGNRNLRYAEIRGAAAGIQGT